MQIELTYNSNHFEGNRLSEEQTSLIFDMHTIGIKNSARIDDIIDFHVRFERVHPFQDGNGRIGRLIMSARREPAGLVHERKRASSLKRTLKS